MSGKSRTLVACCILGFLAACSGDNRPADNSTSHGDSSGDGLALVADDEALYVAVGQRIERRDLVDVSRVAAVIDDTSTLPARRGTIGALHVQNGVLTWTRNLVDSAGADREADEPPAQLLRASTRGGERPTVLLEDASGSIVAVHHGARGISGCMGALNVPGRAFFIGRNDDGTFAPARMFDLAVVPNWGTRHFYCGELYDIEDGGFFVNIKRRPWGDESVWVRFSLDPSVLPEVGVEPPPRTGWSIESPKGRYILVRFVDGERKVVDVGGPLTGALLEDGDGVLVGVHTLSGGNSKDHTCIDGRLVRVTDSGTRNLAEGQCGPVAIAVAGTRVYWLDDLYSAGLRSQTRLKSMELPR